MSRERTTVIWRMLDGRPGHENQVIGLTEAIQRIRSVEVCDIRLDEDRKSLRGILSGWLASMASLPAPDLLIGAGHSTHLPLLACSRRFGGRSVVIMKPSLPVGLFDLCLIPEHDTLCFPANNVVRTEGALNRVRPSDRHDSNCGLILIGGPSKHFLWSDEKVIRQVQAIAATSGIRWTIAASERTPENFLKHLQSQLPNVAVKTPHDTSSDWLPGQLEQAGTVWVTCDSMSMIYEALTAGARVGLLELEPSSPGRISSNIQRLIRSSMVTACSDWMQGRPLSASMKYFSEADRCSGIVVERCLSPDRLLRPEFRIAHLLSRPSSGDIANAHLRGLGSLISEVQVPLR
jgi:mitochondrial fission protein ELM1